MGKMNYFNCRQAYQNDLHFRQWIDMMLMAIDELQITPSELRAMEIFAAIVHEEHNRFPHFVISQTEKERMDSALRGQYERHLIQELEKIE